MFVLSPDILSSPTSPPSRIDEFNSRSQVINQHGVASLESHPGKGLVSTPRHEPYANSESGNTQEIFVRHAEQPAELQESETKPGFGARKLPLSQSALAPKSAVGIAREHFLVLDESGSPSLQSFVGGQTFRENYTSSGVHDGIPRYLRCNSRKADIDFILDAQQAWANKYAGGRSFDHVNDWGDLYLMDISHAPQSYQQHVLQHCLGEVTFDARACFEADYERALACRVSPDMFASAKLFELPDLNPPVAPVNLITGP
ncbi:hypothetical protein E4U23_007104 [Claviceps purpurea]|nr:hypothetical protein E4U23_007104 [Claviceps purpurea]